MSNISTAADLLKQGAGVYAHVYHTDAETFTVGVAPLGEKAHPPFVHPPSSACNVLYLNSVETESLTGPQAIAKATDATLGRNPRPSATVVQFKVTSQGITLTDNQRR